MSSTTNRRIAAYVVSDLISLNIGWLGFNVVRYYSLPQAFTSASLFDWLLWAQPVMGQVLFPIMMIVFYALSGYYNRSNILFKSRLDELLNTMIVTTVGVLAIYFLALLNDGIPERMRTYELLGTLWLWLFAPVYVSRLVITTRSISHVRKGDFAVSALVIGTTRSAVALAERLNQPDRNTGLRVVGYVDPEPGASIWRSDEYDLPVYDMPNLAAAADQVGAKALIVMPHRGGMARTVDLLNHLYPLGLSLYITPDLYHLITMRPRLNRVVGEPLVDITAAGVSAATANFKRLSDIVVSIIALVVLSPVFAAIAFCIKRNSPGPVFYRQERIGYHKRPFNIIKFRTMRTDAESSGPALSSIDDPRITSIGRFLRKYRIDELPQFWNVLRGEMSLIGPRPERDYYIQQIVKRAPYYCLIHQVRPGITSWGMVKYGYASSVDQMIERLRYDLIYIENVSMGVDLKILLHTINTVLTGRGV